MRQMIVASLALAALALAAAAPTSAQGFPDHPITAVVAYPAGGYVDSFARVVTARLSEALGQPIVIVNRPGAGGSIAAESVIRARPDGYTMMIHGASSMAIYSAITAEKPDPNFPPFAIATTVASTPGVMVAASALGVSTFKELMDRVRAEPGKHVYGSAGIGTPAHFWSAQIVRDLKLDVQHTPFAGGAPALNELMAGRVAWVFDTPVGTIAGIQSGKAIPVAVLAPTRLRDLPDTPTVAELGFPGMSEQLSTLFIALPAGTPRVVIDRIRAAYSKSLKETDLAARISQLGSLLPDGATSVSGAEALAHREYKAWFETAMASGVSVR